MMLTAPPMTCPAMEFPGAPPGRAAAMVEPGQCRLENAAIGVSWQISGGKLRPGAIKDRLTGKNISAGAETFSIVLGDGRIVRASDLSLLRAPRAENLSARPEAPQLADHSAGKRLFATLTGDDGTFQVDWQAMLRDGDNYVRQEIGLRTRGKSLPVTEIVSFELPVEGVPTAGAVPGSPVVVGDLFFACENPLSDNRAQAGHVRCAMPWKLVLKAGETLRCTSAVGVAPADQMRRAFLYYVERQRPRAYQPFLHYNSWYDIAWADRKFDKKESLAAIESFGCELVKKRGAKMDSFVFDDGWDDNRTLWGFHSGFPHGFTPLKDSAASYGSTLGVWLSPWGGYGEAKEQRLQYGRTQGFETNAGGFSLAGPKYYARFRQICLDMIHKYGVNCFKFDGVGVGSIWPGEAYRTPRGATVRHGGPPAVVGRIASGPAGAVHQHNHGHMALAILALVRRFHLARWRGLRIFGRRRHAATVDQLPRRDDAAERRSPSPAFPAQLGDEPGDNFRATRHCHSHGQRPEGPQG